METVRQEALNYLQELQAAFRLLKDAPRKLWEGTAGSAAHRTEMLIVMIPIALVVLYLLVSFLKAGWREKLRFLWTALLVIVVLLIIFYVGFKITGISLL